MVFNKKNYPFLEMYEKSSFFSNLDKFTFNADNQTEYLSKIKDINTASLEIYDPIITSKSTPDYYSEYVIDKLESDTKMISMRNLVEDDTGVIIFPLKQSSGVECWTIFYSIGAVGDKTKIFSYIACIGDSIAEISTCWFTSDMENNSYVRVVELSCIDQLPLQTSILRMIIFKQFAKEEKEFKLRARTKQKNKADKYRNELKIDINIIDKTYFTSSYNFNQFSVNGHFRSQPHGKGRTKRKLIWISDFVKNGYSRKAKIAND